MNIRLRTFALVAATLGGWPRAPATPSCWPGYGPMWQQMTPSSGNKCLNTCIAGIRSRHDDGARNDGTGNDGGRGCADDARAIQQWWGAHAAAPPWAPHVAAVDPRTAGASAGMHEELESRSRCALIPSPHPRPIRHHRIQRVAREISRPEAEHGHETAKAVAAFRAKQSTVR